MATYTLTIIDKPGNIYKVTVPTTATVQDVMNAVRPQLQKEYESRFIKVKKVAHQGRFLNAERPLRDYGFLSPESPFQIYLEAINAH